MVGEGLSVQLQRYPYNALLPEEGSAAMGGLTARLGAQWRVALTGRGGLQGGLLSVKACVVIVRSLCPVKGLTERATVPSLLESPRWWGFPLGQQGLGIDGLWEGLC